MKSFLPTSVKTVPFLFQIRKLSIKFPLTTADQVLTTPSHGMDWYAITRPRPEVIGKLKVEVVKLSVLNGCAAVHTSPLAVERPKACKVYDQQSKSDQRI